MSTAATKSQFRTPEYWLALIAVCVLSIFYFGMRAAIVIGLACVTAVLTDFFCLFLQNKSYRKADISNIAAPIVMVLMFPATIPYSVVVFSTIFTVAVGTHVFGSRGSYLFPPAATGYLFALLCWKDDVLYAPHAGVHPLLYGSQETIIQSTMSSEFNADGILPVGIFDILIGNVVSPMGTGSILLLAVILFVLLLRSSLSVWSVAGYLFGLSFLANFGRIPALHYLAVNMVVFSMIFLVGDAMVIPKGRLSLLLGSILTGMLTYYLMDECALEYAPVVAVMLTCPLWHALADIEERLDAKFDAMEREAAQEMMQDVVPAETEVLHETE